MALGILPPRHYASQAGEMLKSSSSAAFHFPPQRLYLSAGGLFLSRLKESIIYHLVHQVEILFYQTTLLF